MQCGTDDGERRERRDCRRNLERRARNGWQGSQDDVGFILSQFMMARRVEQRVVQLKLMVFEVLEAQTSAEPGLDKAPPRSIGIWSRSVLTVPT